jgi:hypothetical protein
VVDALAEQDHRRAVHFARTACGGTNTLIKPHLIA